MADWNVLDIEKPIGDLDKQIDEIKKYSIEHGEDHSRDVEALEFQRDELLKRIFNNLSTWDKVLLARHTKRPYTLDYIRIMFDDYLELHGDRAFADDNAMVGGIGSIAGREVAWVGQQKGRDLKDRQLRNFGSAKPEGYRKAMRIMKLAEKFNRPIICFIDTPAADCTVGSESRGISEAIAKNMMEMSMLKCPVIAIVIGEGGSGGAIGIAVANKVLMLENSIYSVIPPEGCASILWRDKNKASEAAEALKITADQALSLGVIEEVINEPLGAAHRNVEETANNIKAHIIKWVDLLSRMSPDELVKDRQDRFRKFGDFKEIINDL